MISTTSKNMYIEEVKEKTRNHICGECGDAASRKDTVMQEQSIKWEASSIMQQDGTD